jgi:hypothetical protein
MLGGLLVPKPILKQVPYITKAMVGLLMKRHEI